MKKTKEKVFCIRCKYFTKDFPSCDHPQNKQDDWLEEKHGRWYRPREKNIENSCDWFENQKKGEANEMPNAD